MKKSTVIELMGGVVVLAKAVGVTPSAVSQWPDELPKRIVDRVIAACVRMGREVPPGLLQADAGAEAVCQPD